MPDDANTDVKTIQSLQDLAPDEASANLGTDRRQWALRESLIRFGHVQAEWSLRSVRLIGGNKTREAVEALADEG